MTIPEQFLSYFWALEITLIALLGAFCCLIYFVRQNTHAIQNITNKNKKKVTSDSDEIYFDSEKAEKLVENGEVSELSSYCEKFIQQTPHSVQANWYYAIGKYNSGQFEIAREYFEKVIRINPLWRDGAVIYLQEIAEKIGMPPSQTLH
ncbi:MAG: hypothetical protein KGV50_01750 [Gammaproteobacteria bacterium]|nr:hypothetical protein [Gammaproteobacteria bacterium]